MLTKLSLSRHYSAMERWFSAVGCEFSLPAGKNRDRTSDDALLGHPLDFARGSAEQLGQHPHIVLAIAGRAAIGRTADIGRGPAQLHRQLIDRPSADLGAGDFGQPFEVLELRVGVNAVLGVLAHPG